jgi:hypothetical protein
MYWHWHDEAVLGAARQVPLHVLRRPPDLEIGLHGHVQPGAPQRRPHDQNLDSQTTPERLSPTNWKWDTQDVVFNYRIRDLWDDPVYKGI